MESKLGREVSNTIEIPISVVGLLIGKGGETIKQLQQRTGCQIKITKDEDNMPGSETRTVILKGTANTIKKARREIAELIDVAGGRIETREEDAQVEQTDKPELDKSKLKQHDEES